jgi:fatty-acyl-CoA synthase
LPAYARPVFLRVCATLDVTDTFKPKKQDLVREGFDPVATTDPFYVDDHDAGAFVRIDPVLYQRIMAGEIRF